MGKADKYDYGVVLDAGSSGTRVYVYRWVKNSIARGGAKELLKTLPELETHDRWTKKVHPGVSSFGDKPQSIGSDHLKSLLNHALSIVPYDAVSETPIFLLATAGMRLLPEEQRNTLLKNICSYMKTETRFMIRDCESHVQVISGETEGLYGWIAANYLLGGFDEPKEHDHGKGHHTYGFLDMGGASAQIAFAPNITEAEKHANDLKLVRFRTIDGTTQEHRVFVTTWLGFGVHEARRRYLEWLVNSSGSTKLLDPCLPSGYETFISPHKVDPTIDQFDPERTLVGTGQFDKCLKQSFPLLEKDAPCLDEPCLINGQHVPAIDFDVNHFVGISEYWHTTHEIFEMAHKDKAYDFQTYQIRVKEFCERPWSQTKANIKEHLYGKKVDEQAAYEVCFKASWLINMLHDGIGVPRVGLEATPSKSSNGTKEVIENSKQKGYLDAFQAVNKIKSTEVSWTMGKMALYASASVPSAGLLEIDSYPVGFGSNIPGNPIPSDFQYPGGGSLQPASSNSQTSSPFSSKKSDTVHRIPGLLLFLIIIIIALFYLCGRDRRSRFITKHLPRRFHLSSPSNTTRKPYHHYSPTTSSSSILPTFISRLLHPRRSSTEHTRSLEEGSTTHLFDAQATSDFELGDFTNSGGLNSTYDSDTDSVAMPELKINGGKLLPLSGDSTKRSGYTSPTKNRNGRPKLTTSQSAVFGSSSSDLSGMGMATLRPVDAMDRRGLVVRTESTERLDLGRGPAGGRKSRNASRSGSLSPSRSKGNG